MNFGHSIYTVRMCSVVTLNKTKTHTRTQMHIHMEYTKFCAPFRWFGFAIQYICIEPTSLCHSIDTKWKCITFCWPLFLPYYAQSTIKMENWCYSWAQFLQLLLLLLLMLLLTTVTVSCNTQKFASIFPNHFSLIQNSIHLKLNKQNQIDFRFISIVLSNFRRKKHVLIKLNEFFSWRKLLTFTHTMNVKFALNQTDGLFLLFFSPHTYTNTNTLAFALPHQLCMYIVIVVIRMMLLLGMLHQYIQTNFHLCVVDDDNESDSTSFQTCALNLSNLPLSVPSWEKQTVQQPKKWIKLVPLSTKLDVQK